MAINLIENVQEKQLFNAHETVVLALSGGVDSMVLLDVLRQCNITFVVAHVNHQRRLESNREYIEIETFCKQHSIPFEGYILPKKLQGNFHHEARLLRLIFFQKVAKKYNTSKVVLGHHLDDQIETFFMRLVKGVSFLTLSGMPLKQRYENIILVRPLIDIDKQTLLDYANNNNIRYFEDLSNKDQRYTRNRYRKLLAFFRAENNQFNNHFLSTVTSLNHVSEIITKQSTAFLEKYLENNTIDIHEFLALNPLLQEHVMSLYLSRFDCQLTIAKPELMAIVEMLKSKNNFVYAIHDVYTLHKEYDVFFVKTKDKINPFSLKIETVGTYFLPDNKTLVVSNDKSANNEPNQVELWYNNSVFPFIIRHRKPGDWIQFSYGKKKLKDLFIDLKIPPHQRDSFWLVSQGSQIIAIPSLQLVYHQKQGNHKIFIYEV